LIKTGEVVDPNYHVDEKGELHYLFGKKEGKEGKIRTYNRGNYIKDEDRVSKDEAKTSVKESKSRKPAKRKFSDEEEEDMSGTFSCATGAVPSEFKYDTNPLPDFLDPISLEPVTKPAISPYGHVMDYGSWVQCLAQHPKNICPLTKNPLSKRDLVVLTVDNISEYQGKIVNK
jgi:U-box domain